MEKGKMVLKARRALKVLSISQNLPRVKNQMVLLNLKNQRVKVKRVLKARRALKVITMGQNLPRVNH